MRVHLLILLLAAWLGSSIAARCQTGDAPCFCETVLAGNYKVMTSPLLSTCQVNYTHQGMIYDHIQLMVIS